MLYHFIKMPIQRTIVVRFEQQSLWIFVSRGGKYEHRGEMNRAHLAKVDQAIALGMVADLVQYMDDLFGATGFDRSDYRQTALLVQFRHMQNA